MNNFKKVIFTIQLALTASLAFSQAVIRSFYQTPVPLQKVVNRNDTVIYAGSGTISGTPTMRLYVGNQDAEPQFFLDGVLPEERKIKDMWVSADGGLAYVFVGNDSSTTLSIFRCDLVSHSILRRDLVFSAGTLPIARSLSVDSTGRLFACGSFREVGSTQAGFIAKYDSSFNLTSYYTSPFNSTENVSFDHIVANTNGQLTTIGSRRTATQSFGEVRKWTSTFTQIGLQSFAMPFTLMYYANGDSDSGTDYSAAALGTNQSLFSRSNLSGTTQWFLTTSFPSYISQNCAVASDGFYVVGSNLTGSTYDATVIKMSPDSGFSPIWRQSYGVPSVSTVGTCITPKSGGTAFAGESIEGFVYNGFISWLDVNGQQIYRDLIPGGQQSPNSITSNPFQNKVYVATETRSTQSYKGQLVVFVDEPAIDPSTFTITKGWVVSGNASNLTASDGNNLVIQPQKQDIQVEFTAVSPYDNHFAINVNLFGTTDFQVDVNLELWDWSLGEYVVVGTGTQQPLFTAVVAPIGVNPDRYVQVGSRQMKGRVSYHYPRPVKAGKNGVGETMLANIDMFKIYVTAP